MIYVIDTEPWEEEDVKHQCEEHGSEFKNGFNFEQTCTKLASLLVKKHIASRHDVNIDDLTVSENGKPSFPGIQFNISHHKNIVVAVESSSGKSVGVDITDKETTFTPEEQKSLWTLTKEATRNIPTGIYWAAREAYSKYTGQGTQEMPIAMRPPAHLALPDSEVWKRPVMPAIQVEDVYARCFRVRDFVGVVIADLIDLQEISSFSNEKTI